MVALVPDRVLKPINVTAETAVAAATKKLFTLLGELSRVAASDLRTSAGFRLDALHFGFPNPQQH